MFDDFLGSEVPNGKKKKAAADRASDEEVSCFAFAHVAGEIEIEYSDNGNLIYNFIMHVTGGKNCTIL